MDERLPAKTEVQALMRAAESMGGHAMIVARGDEDRGDIFLLIASRGTVLTLIGREYTMDGSRRWRALVKEGADPATLSESVAKRRKADPDCYVVELDLNDPTQFIAEILEIS